MLINQPFLSFLNSRTRLPNIVPRFCQPRFARTGAFAPVQLYPFYENALRASRSQTYAENELESAELYAEFARNASKLPAAWNYGSVKTREEIMWNDKNRMICYPCELRAERATEPSVASVIPNRN